MISFSSSQDNVFNNITLPLQRLSRSIAVSIGEFSLLLVCCNSIAQQQQIFSSLKGLCPADITEIILPSSAESLYTHIVHTFGSTQPEAVMVRGLESVEAIDQLIISTNVMRDELRSQFKFPLILCINDEILRKLVWLAPDLKNWAANTIRFDSPNQSLGQQSLSA
ncbi:MAG: hypothetical protein SAL70_33090 [Scytonema sp. PMC 1070.18]|nr:hypothetical protein [Scytonema sp. PMC 1070.18]